MVAILNNKCVFTDSLGQGDESSYFSVVPPLPHGQANHAIYSSCTQEMYDFDEYDKPEMRFLPKDPDVDTHKSLQ